MWTVDQVASTLRVDRTILFLGAGASVPSGAPTGAQLAQRLAARLGTATLATADLAETASILEYRFSRPSLISALRAELTPLVPTGGLLALPSYPWRAIYTTNFDTLVEQAYAANQEQLASVRSNFEYALLEQPACVPLLKLHGCVTEDIIDGKSARIVVTEEDYLEYAAFRETLFRRLALELITSDVVIVGYSLRDPHLKREVDAAVRVLRDRQGVGRIFLILHEHDDDRALLYERRGLNVCSGDIDSLIQALTTAQPPAPAPAVNAAAPLPPALAGSTITVAHAVSLEARAERMFNGAAASYADIAAGLTFRRDVEPRLLASFMDEEYLFLALVGAAGVGKTTLARRLMVQLAEQGYLCFEHRSEYPFARDAWVRAEAQFRAAGVYAVLLVDDTAAFQRHVNLLADHLASLDQSALLLVLTAGTAQWRPRIKASSLFARGNVETLSLLSDNDLVDLIDLTQRQPAIRRVVAPEFARVGRNEQFDLLRRRCNADMYVCLKNVFASDALDVILLREYAELETSQQDVYRHVAALEATNALVHRQLVVRMLGVDAGWLLSFLETMHGIVDEYDVDAGSGIYGWSTRHKLVAQTIARYKFADEAEKSALFRRVIESANPAVPLELRLLRDLCDLEYGIGSLSEFVVREELLRLIISAAPGERVPRHRLISLYLRADEFELASQEIALAEDFVGTDPPIRRYKVRVLVRRATRSQGLMAEDRRAMLLEAARLAKSAIQRTPGDHLAYSALADVGVALAELDGSVEVIDEAIEQMRNASKNVLDPELSAALLRFERTRGTFH